MKKRICMAGIILFTGYLNGNVFAKEDTPAEATPKSAPMGIMKGSFVDKVKKQIKKEKEEEQRLSTKTDKIIEINSVNFLQYKNKIGEIFISNSDVADVDMLDDRSLYLSGKLPGTTSLVIMDKEGNTLANYQIRVTYPLNEIKNAVMKIYPDISLTLDSVEDNLILQGKVPSPESAADVKDIVSRFVKSEKIINKLSIETATQVMLKVKIAEVSRDVSQNLGINWRALSTGNTAQSAVFGISQGKAADFPVYAANPTLDTIKEGLMKEGALLQGSSGGRWLVSGGVHNVSALIDSLASESLAYVLAEPNLVAISGKSATFKSGGEYGYIVTQPGGSNNNTTEFKDWGTSLEFTPIVLAEDRISVQVKAEVSTIKEEEKEKTPSLETKNVETCVELGSGQSLALAGLLQNTKSTATSEDPILSSIPLLGSLFKSSTVKKTEKELVIIVTPYIVKPASKLKLPTEMAPKMLSPVASILEKKFHHKMVKVPNTGFSLK